MKQLIEDYERRLKTINTELEKGGNDLTINRLGTKASCYRTFIAEIKVTLGFGGSEYLYDTIGKKEVPMWYKDTDGRPLIDLDPYGVDMGGKRDIIYADKKRYEIRYH